MNSEPPAYEDEPDELTRTVSELWLMVRAQQYQLDAHQAELRRLAAGRTVQEQRPNDPTGGKEK